MKYICIISIFVNQNRATSASQLEKIGHHSTLQEPPSILQKIFIQFQQRFGHILSKNQVAVLRDIVYQIVWLQFFWAWHGKDF